MVVTILNVDEERWLTQMNTNNQSAKLYEKGKRIVYIIAAINVAFGIISVITGTSVLTLVVQIVVSIALCTGAGWARMIFLISSALLLMLSLFMLPAFDYLIAFEAIVSVAYMVCLLVNVILLNSNKSVDEFFKIQKVK